MVNFSWLQSECPMIDDLSKLADLLYYSDGTKRKLALGYIMNIVKTQPQFTRYTKILNDGFSGMLRITD